MKIDFHCESFFSDDPRAACQGADAGALSMPQMSSRAFIFLISHPRMISHHNAKMTLCEGCIAAVQRLVMTPDAQPPLDPCTNVSIEQLRTRSVALGNELVSLKAALALQASELEKLKEERDALCVAVFDLQELLAEQTLHTEH